MASEVREHQATNRALEEIYKYISPGTNEGISFGISRLTDDLFTTSFLGGGDISLFTASGARGTIRSQLTNAYTLNSSGGVPATFTFDLSIDLNTGKATLTWKPLSGPTRTATMSLDFVKTVMRPGANLLFTADEVSDDSVYTVSLTLL